MRRRHRPRISPQRPVARRCPRSGPRRRLDLPGLVEVRDQRGKLDIDLAHRLLETAEPGVHLSEPGIDLGVLCSEPDDDLADLGILCSEPGDEIAEIVARARTLTDMRADERRAADLLKELLGGEHEPRDTDGAPGMHDFNLQLDDGRTFAAEVTTDTSRVDKAFRDQINRVSPLDVPGLTRVRRVDLATPGDDPDDQRATSARVEALKAESPDILRQFEHARLTKRRVPRTPSRDDSAAQDSLRGLGVQLCSSFDPNPDQSPQVFFGDASLGGATGPSMIVDAANENSPNKAGKPVNAKTARAAEAHLFLWLNSAQEHKRGRAEAMSFLSRTGLDGLEPIDLQGIDAVWVAVDAGPSHAPDCRHHRPILCFNADGWHDWQLRRSP